MRRLPMVILVSLLAAIAAPAQTWTELFPTGSPPLYWSAKQVHYDPANNRLIAFFPGNWQNGIVNGGEVWILTNANGLGGQPAWTKLETTGYRPFSQGLESVVYDVAGNRLVVYGGCWWHCGNSLFNVFVLTNANGLGGPPEWSDVSVTNPQPRAEHSAVYDAATNGMIAFGGHCGFFGCDQNDTRILSNANGTVSPSTWNALTPASTLPSMRAGTSAIYDGISNRMIVYAGVYHFWSGGNEMTPLGDLWALTNANGQGGTPAWSQLTPSGTLPTPRWAHTAVYDGRNNRAIVFGGLTGSYANQSPLGDLWELRNANGIGGVPAWTQLSQSGALPGPRFYHSAAFDVVNQRMIVFGGVQPNDQYPNRVWVLAFNQAPVAKCRNVTVPAGPACTASASIDNGSSDPDGDPITLTQSPAGPYRLGTTPVTLTVTDNKAASSQCQATVTVADTTPPSIASATATPSVLWPPNHQMVPVTLSVVVSDNCAATAACQIVSVSSNEPPEGLGDGDMAPDWVITGKLAVDLRAERSGTGNGRVYTIMVRCTDAAGNSSSKTVTVSVPHDRR